MFSRLFKRTDFKKLLNEGAVIIDVRNKNEVTAGGLPDAENIPLSSLSGKISQIKKLQVPVICVCASGMRSGMATSQLKAAGIDAYNGGAWTKMIPLLD